MHTDANETMTVNELYDELEQLTDYWEKRASDTPDTPAGRAAAKERRRAAEELREVIRGHTNNPPRDWVED